MYQNVQCCASVNSVKSRWFPVAVGLKQGCKLSPLLFNLYTSDLAMVLKQTGEGVLCDNFRVHMLSYADDICILAESEGDLQRMLQTLATWCENWNLVINTAKTQVVHFRNRKSPRSAFQFSLNGVNLDTVQKYRYLGLVINEHIDMSETAKVVAQSATRALGVLINKYIVHGGMPYKTYSKLYYSLVQPVLEYGAPVWAYKEHSCVKAVQHKAGRFFLGVGRYTPSAAVMGDLGWVPVKLTFGLVLSGNGAALTLWSMDE